MSFQRQSFLCYQRLSQKAWWRQEEVESGVQYLEESERAETLGARPQCGQPSVNLRKSIHKSEKHIRKNLKQHQAGAQLT